MSGTRVICLILTATLCNCSYSTPAWAGDFEEKGTPPSLSPPIIDDEVAPGDEATPVDIAIESLGSLLGGGVGFYLTGIVVFFGLSAEYGMPPPERYYERIMLPMMFLGSSLGCGIGTTLTGEVLDRNGSGRWTIGMSAALGLTETTILMTSVLPDNDTGQAIAISFLALNLFVPVIVYNVTDSPNLSNENHFHNSTALLHIDRDHITINPPLPIPILDRDSSFSAHGFMFNAISVDF